MNNYYGVPKNLTDMEIIVTILPSKIGNYSTMV